MGVKEDKLGLDITGYMFIGEGNTEGLYFRIGVQTPFDTILGYLNLFNDYISKNENELVSKETENTISEKENFIDNPGNKDEEKDNTGDDKDTEDDLLYDFWLKFLSKFGFINPDWSQIPANIVKWYDPLFIKPNNIFLISPDQGMLKIKAKQLRKQNPQ